MRGTGREAGSGGGEAKSGFRHEAVRAEMPRRQPAVGVWGPGARPRLEVCFWQRSAFGIEPREWMSRLRETIEGEREGVLRTDPWDIGVI